MKSPNLNKLLLTKKIILKNNISMLENGNLIHIESGGETILKIGHISTTFHQMNGVYTKDPEHSEYLLYRENEGKKYWGVILYTRRDGYCVYDLIGQDVNSPWGLVHDEYMFDRFSVLSEEEKRKIMD